MLFAGSTDPWHWSEDANPAVDFCVRALRHDGLAVPPFDRHPDGDRTLRDAGLDAGTWRRWLELVLQRVELLDAQVRQPDLRAHRRAIAKLARPLHAPGLLCPGGRVLRTRINELWATCEPAIEEWRRALATRPQNQFMPPSAARRFWRALEPFHGNLPTLRVYLVDYPIRVAMTIPPLSCLVARDAADVDGAGYARAVVACAVELAGKRSATEDRRGG